MAEGVAVAVAGVAGTGAAAVGQPQHRTADNGTAASYGGTGTSDDSGRSDDGGTQHQQQQPGRGVPGGSVGQSGSGGGSHGS
jgi:hypothetical protein